MTARMVQLSGVIVDLIYTVEQVPLPGTEAIVHDSTLTAGGGINAMIAARRTGVAVDYAGTLGTGPLSDIVEKALRAEEIGILRPRLKDMDQGCCTVLVDRDGERSFVAAPGADGVVRTEDLAGIQVRADDWFLISGYALGYAGSHAALSQWLANPPEGLRLVFDPCPLVAQIKPAAREAAMHAATWITANMSEAEFLTGFADPAKAASALAKGRAGGALVRMGADGCHFAAADGESIHLPGYRVDAIDTNGAGDAHTGAFIALLSRGETPLEAAKIANVCAAFSTTREGPATAPFLSTALEAMGR
ncbi:PfkB family carbohydrate kinase [Roseibium sp. SCP14]|uniref:PfkB family carbohydrate kinase n=1 Tax=Roseibium sp. SCP14 TaxID=3141375 RepID=UPI00333B6064